MMKISDYIIMNIVMMRKLLRLFEEFLWQNEASSEFLGYVWYIRADLQIGCVVRSKKLPSSLHTDELWFLTFFINTKCLMWSHTQFFFSILKDTCHNHPCLFISCIKILRKFQIFNAKIPPIPTIVLIPNIP